MIPSYLEPDPARLAEGNGPSGAARGDSGMNLVLVDGPVRFGEVIPPGGPVRVIAPRIRFTRWAGARMRDLEAGLTIAEMLEGAGRSGALECA